MAGYFILLIALWTAGFWFVMGLVIGDFDWFGSTKGMVQLFAGVVYAVGFGACMWITSDDGPPIDPAV